MGKGLKPGGGTGKRKPVRKHERAGRSKPPGAERKPAQSVRKGREGRERSRALKGDAYLIHGRQPVREYLKSGLSREGIEVIFLSESVSDRDLPAALPSQLVHGLTRRDMDEAFPDLNHQGVIIKFRPGQTPFDDRDEDWSGFLKKKPGLLLALDEIQDPQNLGSILRSAEALGVAGVFLTGRGTDISPAAARVSAGAAFHIPSFKVANPNRLLDAGRQAGYFIVSAAGEPDGQDQAKASNNTPLPVDTKTGSRLPAAGEIILFIGNEGSGVRPLVRKKSDFLFSIPMRGRVASLNAGVAAGILIERLLNAGE